MIQQRRLDRAGLAFEPRRQYFGIETVAQGIGAQVSDQPMVFQLAHRAQQHHTEASGIAVPDHVAGPGDKIDMIMFARRRQRLPRPVDGHPAGHAQMAQHHRLILHGHQHILGPAAQREHLAPRQLGGKVVGHRPSEARLAHFNAIDHRALQDRRQTPADCFHFR